MRRGRRCTGEMPADVTSSSLEEYSTDESSTEGSSSSGGEREHGNDAWLTAGIIVADVVGAGILTMASAVAKLGWFLGGIILVLMLAANVHISLLMWRVRMGIRKTKAKACKTYADLVDAAFQKAPRWQRIAMHKLTTFSQYVFIFIILGIYLLSAGKGLGMAFYSVELCLPAWALIAALILLPFAATSRQMGTYQSLVWLNIVTLCGTVMIPLSYYMVYGTEGVRHPESVVVAVAPLTQSGVLYALSAFTFGMTSQFMLNEIMSEMKDVSELPQAYVKISAPFQALAFLVAGLGGYVLMGDKVTGMLNENLPFNVSFQVASICLLTHMLISYLIKGVVFGQVVQGRLFPDVADPEDPQPKAKWTWAFMTVVVLFCAWLFANTVPFFADAVDLLGASLTPISCWLIPIALYLRYIKDADEAIPRPGVFETIVIFCEVALALVLMFVGTYEACVTLMEHWHTYGYPFECHCEGLWKTCECSSDHAGMAGTCLETVTMNRTLHGLLSSGPGNAGDL